MEIGFPKKMAHLTEWSLMHIRISLKDQQYTFLTSLRACTAG